MNKKVLQTVSYLDYLIRARHSYGHGIHSPFIYELASKVLFDPMKYPEYDRLKSVRNSLMQDKDQLLLNGFGAGSVKFTGNSRKVADITKISSVRPKFLRLLFRLAKYNRPGLILELGTSLGLSAMAFGMGCPDAKVVTIEAEPALCEFAAGLFDRTGIANILIRQGLFEEQLPAVLNEYPAPGIVFIDGNHAYEPTLRYFREIKTVMTTGILIFDDICWSEEMCHAWQVIRTESEVSIDLFSMGLVIIRPRITPGNYRIRF